MAVDILPEKTTMTSHHYTGALLAKVVSAVLEQQLNVRITRRTLLLHGNATPPHKTRATTQCLEGEQLRALAHPPYSPNVIPFDVSLSLSLKTGLPEEERFLTK